MKTKASDLITRAKVQLILNQPFFATLALRMKYTEDPKIETACIDGKEIKYNPKFVESLSMDELQGLLAHEVMHIASLHHTRRQGRNAKRWNIACDYAINPLIQRSNLKLPAGALINPAFNGMSAEQIFSALPKDDQKGQDDDDQPGKDPGQCGAVADAPGQSESERTQEEAEIKQAIAQAATMAKQAGKLPGHLQDALNDLLAPAVNWREVLSRFMDQVERNDYTYKRPNTRYLPAGLYLPALESLTVGNFILIADTSASVDAELLSQFAGEIQEISETFGNKEITVLHVDTKLQHVQEYSAGDTMTPHGRGGTDFRPGFEWIEQQGESPAAIIYLTDGECDTYPESAPDCPVLWAVYGHYARHFSPPFGEVVPVLSK